MKEGAYDYVPKPFRPDEVELTLRKAEERERLGHTIATLRAQLDSSPAARALIAESLAMRQALETVARVAEHPTTVLITGERGTGKDLAAEAATGRFRHDLFDRLNVVAIHLSPLSERRADIAPLARHFAARLAGRLGRRVALSDTAVEWLGEQPWPGNVRSLEHAIERAAVLSDKEILEAGDFVGPRPLSPAPQRGEGERGGEVTLRDAVERRSEERRVGEECRSRWSPYHLKKKKKVIEHI